MLLAQLTDTHIVGATNEVELYVDNNRRLTQAVDRLNAETVQPDAVLVTGDLTENGTSDEMDLLVAELARLRAPVLPLPGNHDRRETFRSAFDMAWASNSADQEHLSWVAPLNSPNESVRVIGLDTVVPGSHGGAFDRERELWLRTVLADAPDQPTVIAMHHPPFASGIQWMDEMGLLGADAFAAVVSEFQNVVRILCGHLHRPMTTTIGGVTTTVGLSTAHHVELNLDPGATGEVIRDPAGYQLHYFNGSRWVTHNRHIDTGEEAFAPKWQD